MSKIKRILIALAVIGTNVLHTMPVHTALAAEPADFEITTNGVTSTTGDTYYNESTTTDTIKNTNATYQHTIKGNVNFVDGTSTSHCSGNEISIRRGTYNHWVYGAFKVSEDIIGNKVTVYGGILNSVVSGGCSSTRNAENNHVLIKGGTISSTASIYGGYAGSALSNGNAINNTVTIESGTFIDGFKLYGGYASGTSTGNELNLKIKMRGKASDVKFFQIMNFTLPSDITNNGVMLETASVTYDNTTIDVKAANGVTLKKDDKIYLIKADSGGGSISNDEATVLGGAGQISLVGYNLILTMLQDFSTAKGGSEDQQKAPVEGMAAAMAIVNQSADLASGKGMESLLINTEGHKLDTFGAMSAGSSKYKTGSHVDVDGWGVIVGAGNTKKWDNGNATTYGLFFEYGKGDFDTYNGNVHGDGNSENKGVGIMIRHQLANNTYFEGNVRYGKQETEWSESELGGYETDSKYHGAMVGFG